MLQRKSAMSKSKSKLMTLTARCDCPRVGDVRRLRKNESWIVKILVDQHNHLFLRGRLLSSNRHLHRQNDDLRRRLDQLSRVQMSPAS